MAIKIYKFDNIEYEVNEEKEDKFLKDFPNAVLQSDEPGKLKGSAPDVDVEQTQEVNQSQNNQQQINTESKSEDGSSGLEKFNKIPKRNIEKLPNENFFDSKKSDIISQGRELYQLEEDIIGIDYENKAKGFEETSNVYNNQLEDLKIEIDKIVNGKYETEESYNLAKLDLE